MQSHIRRGEWRLMNAVTTWTVEIKIFYLVYVGLIRLSSVSRKSFMFDTLVVYIYGMYIYIVLKTYIL